MGAISSPSSLSALKRDLNDSNRSVCETCEIPLAMIEWDHSEEGDDMMRAPSTSDEHQSVRGGLYFARCTHSGVTRRSTLPLRLPASLQARERHGVQCRKPTLDPSRHASPALRTLSGDVRTAEHPHRRGGRCACSGVFDASALFLFNTRLPLSLVKCRLHISVPALLQVLQNPHESDMVRHELAEALEGIATPEVLPYLKEYMAREDAPVVVGESCQVASGHVRIRQWFEYYTK